jgi:hypothetical protein
MPTLRHLLDVFRLTLPLQLRTPHGLLCHLSDQALVELEKAPFVGICLLTALQSDQEAIGQDGQDHRAPNTLGFRGHLPLSQMPPAFECLQQDFHLPDIMPPKREVFTRYPSPC